jgi:hypothetical protein
MNRREFCTALAGAATPLYGARQEMVYATERSVAEWAYTSAKSYK